MKKIKNNLGIIIGIIVLGIIFFSYNIILTLDASEYLGLSNFIGTEKMQTNWVKHRGIAFPLLLKICEPFGIHNKIFFLICMFIFYLIMIFSIIKIYKKCKELFNNKISNIIFITGTIFLIILNPIIFSYFHTVMTEFVAIPLTVLAVLLGWNWIDASYKKTYVAIFSIITIVLYHTKQAYVVIPISVMLISSLISIIKYWNLKNVLYRICSVILTIVFLIISIEIWNLYMKDANVLEGTIKERVNDRIADSGLITLETVYNSKYDVEKEINIDELDIKAEEKEEINNILNGKSEKYENFIIFQNGEGKYFVYFRNNGSIKDQLNFYFKVVLSSPMDILKSYKINYEKLIFSDGLEDKELDFKIKYGYYKENYDIPRTLFGNGTNLTNVISNGYDEYFEYYVSENPENFITKIFNKIENFIQFPITVFTKINLYWCLPTLCLLSFIAYCIFHKKADKNKMKILELIIICYLSSFMLLAAYVIMGAKIDRYTVPTFVPTYIGDILLIGLLVKCVYDKIKL